MSLQVKQLYEFDRYRLDPARHALLSDGDPVLLTPKAFDTLLALVRHGGDVVGKDELLKEVWPDTFVEEATLTQNVSTLRKALGRDRSGKQFIEIVPKYGYRFAAPVSAHSISDNHVLPQQVASHVVPSARAALKPIPRRWLLILVLLILVPAALVTVKFFARSRPQSDEPPFQKMRLARLTNHGNVTRAVAVRKRPDVLSNKAIAWSPDGKAIVYTVRVGDNTDPYMMLIAVSLAEGTEKILTQDKWFWIGEAAWLRDGSRLVLERGVDINDAVLISNSL